MTTTDGGTAFPMRGDGDNRKSEPGMTLREWYAGMALQGLLARTQWLRMSPDQKLAPPAEDIKPQEVIALAKSRVCEVAFEYADAMLSARSASAPTTQGETKP